MSIKAKKTANGIRLDKANDKPSNPNAWKDRYDITCPYCLHEMQCTPSIFHYMGSHELGGGSCSECNKGFEIHFISASNAMQTHKRKSDDEIGVIS